jgi:HPt (histidine-containing phosphotransfer) domain-containing protein
MDALPPAVDEKRIALLRDLGGPDEPGFVPGLVKGYLAHADGAIAAMRKAAESGADADLERAAHGLKGSSANLGASGLAAICADLQRAGAARTARAAGPRVEAAAAEYARVRARLARELPAGTA